MSKEQEFYKTLKETFIGAKVEGQGGFINLMTQTMHFGFKNS
jgi:hypothetical protein